MMRIAGLPVPGPSDVLTGARAVVGWTESATDVVADLPARATRLLDGVEGLLARVTGIADRVEHLVGRAEHLVDDVALTVGTVQATVGRAGELVDSVDAVAADAARLVARVDEVAGRAEAVVGRADQVAGQAGGVVDRAGEVAGRAGSVVDEASATSRTAGALLETYRPILDRAAPLAGKFVEELSEDEVQAAIELVDLVPALAKHMDQDIMPILGTLDRVGPDVHELLDVLKEVRHAITGIPGFKLFRRRGEREEAEEREAEREETRAEVGA